MNQCGNCNDFMETATTSWCGNPMTANVDESGHSVFNVKDNTEACGYFTHNTVMRMHRPLSGNG